MLNGNKNLIFLNAWAVLSSSCKKFILKLEPTSFAQGSWRETGREQEQPHLIIFPFVHTPDAAKQRAFREMGQSVKPLDPWPLASIELEGKAKERRSSDGQ